MKSTCSMVQHLKIVFVPYLERDQTGVFVERALHGTAEDHILPEMLATCNRYSRGTNSEEEKTVHVLGQSYCRSIYKRRKQICETPSFRSAKALRRRVLQLARVNNEDEPGMFVIFHDDQSYPEYRIEYAACSEAWNEADVALVCISAFTTRQAMCCHVVLK